MSLTNHQAQLLYGALETGMKDKSIYQRALFIKQFTSAIPSQHQFSIEEKTYTLHWNADNGFYVLLSNGEQNMVTRTINKSITKL